MKKVKTDQTIVTAQNSGQNPEDLFIKKNGTSKFEQLTLDESIAQESSNAQIKEGCQSTIKNDPPKAESEVSKQAVENKDLKTSTKQSQETNQQKSTKDEIKQFSGADDEQQRLEEAQEAVKSQKSKKKKWMSLAGFLINIAVVAGILTYQLLGDTSGVANFKEFAENFDWGIGVVLLLFFGVIMLLETLKFFLLIKKTTGKSRFGLAYKTTALGKYYDSITPLSAGGEPFQIYYLNKRGVSGSNALSITMAKHVFWQLIYIVFCLAVMIFGITFTNTTSTTGTTVVSVSSWIGLALNSVVTLFLAIISLNRKIGVGMVSGIMKFLGKIKIIKNPKKSIDKVLGTVDTYQGTMKKYAKDKGVSFGLSALTLAVFIATYSIPFFIYGAIYHVYDPVIYADLFIKCVMVDLAASFIPIPGGSGAAEISFTALLYIYFADGGYMFWAMLIWRILNYYSLVIQGVLVLAYDYVRGNKKHEWEAKKWSLEKESRDFEAKELQDFELSLNKKSNKKEKRK